MYGSNFCIRTRRPRCSSSMPIEALVNPFPSELTTPPVTKMNLVMNVSVYPKKAASGHSPYTKSMLAFSLSFDKRPVIMRRIDAQRGVGHDGDGDGVPAFQHAQLLEFFGL